MKFSAIVSIVAWLAQHVVAFNQIRNVEHHPRVNHLRTSTPYQDATLTALLLHDAAGGRGHSVCPCIGFDDTMGETTALLSDGGSLANVSYPADLGGSCEAWDLGHHPECGGSTSPDWCRQRWCYVDPRHCGLPDVPKENTYQPMVTFQMMPLYYSYATCDATDSWSKVQPEIGMVECRCIGFHGSPGTTMATIGSQAVEYPAEVGGSCSAWDGDRHPDCNGKNPPDWCSKQWCFVDPCSCQVDAPPKVSNYLADGTFKGKPVFYSYATCGEKDSYSSNAQLERSRQVIGDTCGPGAPVEGGDAATGGSPGCPCIGFDHISGTTEAQIMTNKSEITVTYPADLGGSCQPWDGEHHPDCTGAKPASWCKNEWCYVDPKNCDIDVLPKRSLYQPGASFQSLPLYYSYATCDAVDSWTKKKPEVGMAGCHCIGFDDAPGTFMVKVGDQQIEYPKELGGECQAWDEGLHPDCPLGDSNAEWCNQRWCFVDPCSCTAPVPPKVSDYLGDATFQGRPIFWSYSTCGSKDSYSSKEQRLRSAAEIQKTCAAPLPSTPSTPTTPATLAKSGVLRATPWFALAMLAARMLQ